MSNLGRRDILASSGLMLALAGCGGGTSSKQGKERDCVGIKNNPGLNYGMDPTGFHPSGSAEKPAQFDPTHIGILHLELAAVGDVLKMIATRAHFPRDPNTQNDLAGNMDLISKALIYLNDPHNQPPVDGLNTYPGIKKVSFRRPTHVIIYIKNHGMDYAKSGCVWFGEKLHNTSGAAKNESFFEAKPYDFGAKIINGSQKFVYMKNYFTYMKGATMSTIDADLYYSLNVNAVIFSNDGLDIPVIIDPDTGNMGTGNGDGMLGI